MNGGSQTVARVLWGNNFNLMLTSIYLCVVGNLEPQFGNHGPQSWFGFHELKKQGALGLENLSAFLGPVEAVFLDGGNSALVIGF